MKRLPAAALALGLLLTACVKEDVQKRPFTDYQPQPLPDGWALASAQAENIRPDSLRAVYRALQDDPRYWQVRSLSVFRNGRLVAESYFKDAADRTTPRPVWSCTKQVLGLLVGIALDQGLIRSLEDPISRYLPAELAAHPDKQGITIRDLLTMRSGIAYENYGLTSNDAAVLQQKPADLLGYILALPLADAPGRRFVYKDSDPQLLSAILAKVSGKPTRRWADEVLFRPLGFRNYDWATYHDGSTLGAFGILTTPRELAKIAQCVLEGGRFQGRQVVSARWIAEMTRERAGLGPEQGFGYMWWSYPTRGLVYMSGNGGQFAMLVPAKNLLVVFTAEDKTQGSFRFSTPNARYFTERIARISF